MTVAAQQHALRGLLARAFERARNAGVREPECLRRGIEVMEVQRPCMPVVATQDAAAAGLGDEDRLDRAAARGDPLLAAALAPVMVVRSVADEGRRTVRG